jgi:hypothetical protein
MYVAFSFATVPLCWASLAGLEGFGYAAAVWLGLFPLCPAAIVALYFLATGPTPVRLTIVGILAGWFCLIYGGLALAFVPGHLVDSHEAQGALAASFLAIPVACATIRVLASKGWNEVVDKGVA